MSGPDFEELVGNDVPAAERERLLRVHELLVTAGPPPDLPPALERAPAFGGRVSFLPRRRRGALLAFAAALAAAAFGAGYFAGDRGDSSALKRDFVLKMEGTQAAPGAVASLVVYEKDDDGNWPMELTVRNLPPLGEGTRYELFLTRRGKLAASCGTFFVTGNKAVAYLNAPYKLRQYDGWVIVRQASREVLVRTRDI